MNHRIRTATPADVDALAALHVRVWRATYAQLAPREAYDALDESRRRPHWDGLLRRDPATSISLIAEDGGRAVGLGHACPAGHEALGDAGEILHLYVDPEHQGTGLGRELFGRLRTFLTGRGHRVVRLAVVEGNDPAIGFYERQGGRRVGSYVDGVLWRSQNLVYEWEAGPGVATSAPCNSPSSGSG